MAVKHGHHLACNLARSQIALQPKLGGQAELAVDSATHLAGDADGGAIPAFSFLFRLVRLAPVAAFAPVAFRHPDGLNGLPIPVLTLDQVALGPVRRLKDLLNFWPAYLPAFVFHPLAQRLGQRSDQVNFSKPLTINRFSQLAPSPGWLARRHHPRRQRLPVHAEKGQ